MLSAPEVNVQVVPVVCYSAFVFPHNLSSTKCVAVFLVHPGHPTMSVLVLLFATGLSHYLKISREALSFDI